ncbi:MAG TPA: hydroxyacylglutathione hydrolase family protein [Nitrososphaeraceae archaeon]|jgi:glyoxylase-like metal-dependent hydrolase (beta-lactamase superfamily II)|nr:hydroxyacylglutathione hydrolase family protein [Nitrososphaeraceae archaeon]
MTFKIEQIPVGKMANFTYLIIDNEEKETAIIDPSWDLEKIFEIIKKNEYKIKYIINTHSHYDHILGNDQIVAITKCKVIQHKNSKEKHDISVNDGDEFKVGKTLIKVFFTPGHSKDSICLIVDSKIIITGDTLFIGNCGRTDLPGSDPEEMYNSLFEKILNLDNNLVVYPGHNYGYKSISTIGEEKKNNYVLFPRSKEQFIKFMTGEE